MLKKYAALVLMALSFSLPTITVMADINENDDATGYTQQVVSQNIVGDVIGNASIISDDDPLLDGHFHNGELVNGFICHNKTEAEQALIANLNLQNDTAPLLDEDGNPYRDESSPANSESKIYPITGRFVGIDNDSSGDSYTDGDQSYTVTLVGPSGTVGSYRGYADNVNGGLSFNTTKGVGVYNVRIAINGLNRNIYLNGDGNADL